EGPAIFTGPTSDPELTGALIKFAESSSINYQLRAAAEPEESEAWPLQVACGGIPLAVISIPVKYRYSSVEEANLGDLETAAELLSGYLTILEKADWGKLLCC
ncbi:MAG TPA: hypothetical protein VHR42_01030, partial [Clostridia bacterium]|nr:hypothetical protein [Clostridia bacterium]